MTVKAAVILFRIPFSIFKSLWHMWVVAGTLLSLSCACSLPQTGKKIFEIHDDSYSARLPEARVQAFMTKPELGAKYILVMAGSAYNALAGSESRSSYFHRESPPSHGPVTQCAVAGVPFTASATKGEWNRSSCYVSNFHWMLEELFS